MKRLLNKKVKVSEVIDTIIICGIVLTIWMLIFAKL